MLRGSRSREEVSSPIEKSFGAEVKLTLPEPDQRQLFLVVSSSAHTSPAAPVRARQGRIVLDAGAWVIAEMSFEEAMEVQSAREIASVGGVSLDPQRFKAFNELSGLEPSHKISSSSL